MKRRSVLGLGAAGVAVTGFSLLGYRFAPPKAIANPRQPMTVAAELLAQLPSKAVEAITVPYDHPFRQYHNRGVWAGGQLIALGDYSRDQLALISELMYAGLSTRGRSIIPNQYYLSLPDIMINNLLICGDPTTAECQILITGPHLNLRIGGASSEGVAFGGPQVYGDQRGNEVPGIPDNTYVPTMNAGMSLFRELDPGQQSRALLPHSPVQTQIELRGSAAEFDGISIGELAPGNIARVREIIDLTMGPYPSSDTAYAWECINANGGVEALSLAYYEDSSYESGEAAFYQTFRIEGPSAVFYFRGFPHVHAFFNVGMDGDAPLSVGEIVGETPTVIEGESLASLMEASMLAAEKTDFAFYDNETAVGRIRAGIVRTGDLYNAESWMNDIHIVEIRGREISGAFADRIESSKIQLVPDQRYTIATTDYIAGSRMEDTLGNGKVVREGPPLRDRFIAYVRQNGFA